MFLRVSDVLIDLLLQDLRRLDCIERATKLKDLSRLNHLQKYQSTLHIITGFDFWIEHESKVLKYRTLTGQEKLKLFTGLNITETFPEVPNAPKIQLLWQKLLAINSLLSAWPEDVTPALLEDFQDQAK